MSRPYAEVIGDPIAQSKSPAIHTFWLEKLGIDADYRAAHVRAGELAAYLDERKADPGWRGCNVTMPHKQAVVSHLARRHPLVERIGAVSGAGSTSSPNWTASLVAAPMSRAWIRTASICSSLSATKAARAAPPVPSTRAMRNRCR